MKDPINALKDMQVCVDDKDGIDLIIKMIEIDPAKRITIDEIKKHPWFNNVATQDELVTFYHQI